jgi:hypothetical protein
MFSYSLQSRNYWFNSPKRLFESSSCIRWRKRAQRWFVGQLQTQLGQESLTNTSQESFYEKPYNENQFQM